MKMVTALTTLALALVSCGKEMRVTEWESAETQMTKTCQALGQGLTYVESGQADDARDRFEYANRSANAYVDTIGDVDARTLQTATAVLASLDPAAMADTPAADDLSKIQSAIDLCNSSESS